MSRRPLLLLVVLAALTYLVPAVALGYGAAVLAEPVHASALAGLALVLTGVGLGTGAIRRRRAAAGGAA